MTSRMTANLDNALRTFSQGRASNLGISQRALYELEELEANHALGKAGAVGISADIQIPVSQGYGNTVTPKYPTFWATFQGSAQITAPNDGTTWTVVVTDIAQNKQIFSGNNLSAGTPVPFSYSTGFTCQIKAEAWCSDPNEKTTLVVHVDIS